MLEKPWTEQLESIFLSSEADMRAKATSQAGYLFRWMAGRLLLGADTGEAPNWLANQLDGFEPTGAVKKDINKWLHLVACMALLGMRPTEQARQGCDFLRLEQRSAADYAMVQAGLALSILGERPHEAREWLEKQYALPPRPEAETFAFELMVMASAQIERRRFDVQWLCDLASRVFVDSLWAPPPYSAAPHFCVAAMACSLAGGSLPELLSQRLADMDARAFGPGRRPRISVSPVRIGCKSQLGGLASLNMSVKIGGVGELDPGLHDLGPVLSKLPDYLKSEQSVCLLVEMEPGVVLSGEAQRYIQHRANVACEYARRQIPGINDNVKFALNFQQA